MVCYETLADIRMAQGRMDEAESLYQSLLQEEEHPQYRMLVYSHLAQLYEKRGDYERAYAMRLRHDEISDSLVKANDSQRMAQWQQQYDEERQAKEFYRRTSWMLGLIIALAVVVALSIAVGTWWHRRKVRRLSFRLDEDARRISELRTKRWQEWERKYSGLSTAQYIFLIMQDDLRFDDETIAAALAVKRTSVRSMRSRIKGRER